MAERKAVKKPAVKKPAVKKPAAKRKPTKLTKPTKPIKSPKSPRKPSKPSKPSVELPVDLPPELEPPVDGEIVEDRKPVLAPSVPSVPSASTPRRDPYARRLARLTVKMLQEVEWQLDHAPPDARREILKSVVPHLFRVQQEQTVDDELAELRRTVVEQNEQLLAIMYNRQPDLPSMPKPIGPPAPPTDE